MSFSICFFLHLKSLRMLGSFRRPDLPISAHFYSWLNLQSLIRNLILKMSRGKRGIPCPNRGTGRDRFLGRLEPSVGERCFNHPEFLISEWAPKSGNGSPISEVWHVHGDVSQLLRVASTYGNPFLSFIWPQAGNPGWKDRRDPHLQSFGRFLFPFLAFLTSRVDRSYDPIPAAWVWKTEIMFDPFEIQKLKVCLRRL